MSDEDNIIREVEEDLRRERYEQLWKKYGPFVIGTIVVVLVSMVGWQQWQAWQERQREKDAERFLAAVELMGQNKEAAAANAFGELAEKAGPGYRAVARLHEAQAYLEQGNPDQALAAFESLAADGSVNPKLRGLAALKSALLLADSEEPAKLQKRLAEALRPNSPWRFAAREVLAYSYYRSGNFGEARNQYQKLVNEYDAPPHIRNRAGNMMALIASEEARGQGADKPDPASGGKNEPEATTAEGGEEGETGETAGGDPAAKGDSDQSDESAPENGEKAGNSAAQGDQ